MSSLLLWYICLGLLCNLVFILLIRYNKLFVDFTKDDMEEIFTSLLFNQFFYPITLPILLLILTASIMLFLINNVLKLYNKLYKKISQFIMIGIYKILKPGG